MNQTNNWDDWKKELEKIGEQTIKGNYFDCKCCGEPHHRQYDSDIKVKELFCYKQFELLISQELTNLLKTVAEAMGGESEVCQHDSSHKDSFGACHCEDSYMDFGSNDRRSQIISNISEKYPEFSNYLKK